MFVDVARNAYVDRSDRYDTDNLFRRLAQKEDPWLGMGRRTCSAEAAPERFRTRVHRQPTAQRKEREK